MTVAGIARPSASASCWSTRRTARRTNTPRIGVGAARGVRDMIPQAAPTILEGGDRKGSPMIRRVALVLGSGAAARRVLVHGQPAAAQSRRRLAHPVRPGRADRNRGCNGDRYATDRYADADGDRVALAGGEPDRGRDRDPNGALRRSAGERRATAGTGDRERDRADGRVAGRARDRPDRGGRRGGRVARRLPRRCAAPASPAPRCSLRGSASCCGTPSVGGTACMSATAA